MKPTDDFCYVRAKRSIFQSPVSEEPDVPGGTLGSIEDTDTLSDVVFVDFGDVYGVVMCEWSELSAVNGIPRELSNLNAQD